MRQANKKSGNSSTEESAVADSASETAAAVEAVDNKENGEN